MSKVGSQQLINRIKNTAIWTIFLNENKKRKINFKNL